MVVSTGNSPANESASEPSEVAGVAALASALWDVREAMGLVLFKLAEERLVVAAGQTRWLADANRELENALELLHRCEVLRAMETAAVLDRLSMEPDSTLAELAVQVNEPWATMLLEHRESMLRLADEIADAVEENRRLLDSGAKMVRETLLSITDSAGTYDARGLTDLAGIRLSRLDAQA